MKQLSGVLLALAMAGGTVLSVGLGMDMRSLAEEAHACCPAGSQPGEQAPEGPSCCLLAPGHLAQAPALAAPDRHPLPAGLPSEPAFKARCPGLEAAPAHGPPVREALSRSLPSSPRAPPLA